MLENAEMTLAHSFFCRFKTDSLSRKSSHKHPDLYFGGGTEGTKM
jgi:hypothetical protein